MSWDDDDALQRMLHESIGEAHSKIQEWEETTRLIKEASQERFTMHVGAEYFIEMSKANALRFIQDRKAYVREKLNKSELLLQSLAKLSQPSDTMEIIEDLDEEGNIISARVNGAESEVWKHGNETEDEKKCSRATNALHDSNTLEENGKSTDTKDLSEEREEAFSLTDGHKPRETSHASPKASVSKQSKKVKSSELESPSQTVDLLPKNANFADVAPHKVEDEQKNSAKLAVPLKLILKSTHTRTDQAPESTNDALQDEEQTTQIGQDPQLEDLLNDMEIAPKSDAAIDVADMLRLEVLAEAMSDEYSDDSDTEYADELLYESGSHLLPRNSEGIEKFWDNFKQTRRAQGKSVRFSEKLDFESPNNADPHTGDNSEESAKNDELAKAYVSGAFDDDIEGPIVSDIKDLQETTNLAPMLDSVVEHSGRVPAPSVAGTGKVSRFKARRA